jgi:ATP-dependent Zn protease
MIEQICSMALTGAHHEGLEAFQWQHLVEATTTIESGTAISIDYVEHETRAVAIHEAGHAAAAHVYKPELESSRLSIRMRGGSLGHHQSFEKEERFSHWRHEDMNSLVHTLGAMAAEYVFYGENSRGVGGDLMSATALAAQMVGASGMAPPPVATKFADETSEQTRARLARRFEAIGVKLMNRTRGSVDFHADPIAAILADREKRAFVAQMLGQAFVTAENFIRANKPGVERIAEALIEKKELFGDDLVELLNAQNLRQPALDFGKDDTWPRI